MQQEKKLRIYYFTALLSMLFALIGFSYNAWRLEATEENSNTRTAAFAVLSNLAELEQIVYAAYYDKNMIEGSPRKGWVKVGLIGDLSALISKSTEKKAQQLKSVWSSNWEKMAQDRQAVDYITMEIDYVRESIKSEINQLD